MCTFQSLLKNAPATGMVIGKCKLSMREKVVHALIRWSGCVVPIRGLAKNVAAARTSKVVGKSKVK